MSTFSFGEGRTKNLMYVVTPAADAGDNAGDVLAVVSLMHTGGVEVRLLRGAPDADGGDLDSDDIFAVFSLDSTPGPCPF